MQLVDGKEVVVEFRKPYTVRDGIINDDEDRPFICSCSCLLESLASFPDVSSTLNELQSMSEGVTKTFSIPLQRAVRDRQQILRRDNSPRGAANRKRRVATGQRPHFLTRDALVDNGDPVVFVVLHSIGLKKQIKQIKQIKRTI